MVCSTLTVVLSVLLASEKQGGSGGVMKLTADVLGQVQPLLAGLAQFACDEDVRRVRLARGVRVHRSHREPLRRSIACFFQKLAFRRCEGLLARLYHTAG